MEKLTQAGLAQLLPKRPRDFHKGNAGHVLVIGGDYGYSGAVRLAAEAALRVGAGLVSVITHKEHAWTMNVNRPEIMCHAVESDKALEGVFKKANVLVLGPGLGRGSFGRKLFAMSMRSSLPCVVDADALTLLAEHPVQRESWIVTPHPGEAARLLKTTPDAIQKDRVQAVKALQQKYLGIAVLKGYGTLVAGKGGVLAMCEAGNPGMATAGMGDVLSGVLGGLLAQGLSLHEAAQYGVLLHAMAGDLAAKEGGERGMLALDLMPYLRRLVN